MLLAAADGWRATAAVAVGAALLTFGFIEIFYTSLMTSVFKRPPALWSDLSLLRSGLALAQRQAYWLVPAAIALIAATAYGSYELTALLFRSMPDHTLLPLALALSLLPSAVYHWRRYNYGEYIWRVVYSPTLHFWRSLRHSGRVRSILAMDESHFERFNYFKNVSLARAPNIVIVCIEAYGSVVHRDPRYTHALGGLLRSYEDRLAATGYRFASTHSAAPLFAGGSWLSYASFTYGVAITDLDVYDALFSHAGGFRKYESLFHVLRRNGYHNVLLCPLGGVDPRTLDWTSLDRCFQSDRRIAFEDLGYAGPVVNYFGLIRRYSPLDQYSLNFGYERARAHGTGPFSLFFCTLNSHYPWAEAPTSVDDWRALNRPGVEIPRARGTSTEDRYAEAIRYQLDYVLRFATERAADAPLIIVFGDHQPPMITPESMGTHTPVHILSRDPAVIDVLLQHGLAPALDLAGVSPRDMRHEGFLSLLMRALDRAYGDSPRPELPYLEAGANVFDGVRPGRSRCRELPSTASR